MKSEGKARLDRRQFLALGAAAGTLNIVGGETVRAEPLVQDGPSRGSTPAKIAAQPLPEKVANTAVAGISRKTHEEHYELYKVYVNRVNEIRGKLAGLAVPEAAKANATYSDLRELKVEYSFALGGVKNHELYFSNIGGKGGVADGPIGEAIKVAFGSYENWKADLVATGLAARGWVWLAHDYTDGSLFNYIGDAQNAYPVWHATPLLGLDVYEHAYFIDFGRDRARYIEAFCQVIDWDTVNANFKVAEAIAAAGKK